MIEDLWYKNTVIYSLDLETFMDANGDGVGDFKGLMHKLDYLHSLGVGTVWLAPFQPTPNRDNGYDISDYYGVDPRHGSSGDFVEFMHQAKKRGIKVIIDLVVNHTSDEHAWFQASRSDEKSPYHDWYIWSKEKPSDWNEGMVFPGVQEATWTYDRKAQKYFYHRFYKFQPDLNIENPEVREEIDRIMGFWLELGVAGFRVDAVPFIIETSEPGKKEPEMMFDYVAEMRRFLQWRQGDAVLLGEANVLPEVTKKYFGNGDGIHMMFNFYVNQHLFYALASGDIEPLAESLKATKEIFPTAQWAVFLRNHDELDLGRLTEEQRAKVFEKFGPEKNMQLYDRGIRRRLAPMLGNRPQLELAYSLVFSLPGTPVLRYGDEIGMGDDLELKEREAVRTPMQWNDGPQAGFSSSENTIHPVIDKGPYTYHKVNVEAQRRDSDSLLNWTSTMIRLRKECPEIGWGDWAILKTEASDVLVMRYDWQGSTLIILHNFHEKPREVSLKLNDDDKSQTLINLLEDEKNEVAEDGTYHILMEAFGYCWYRLGAPSPLFPSPTAKQKS
uniref:Alpha-amylase n=1 Tax=Roseihalotalea indica TaxID=2867963 RepID=A0AA49GN43_9BACT|nr:alpha-amylase family protein [Tunicatimonas sp. TK19036]